MVIQIEKDGGRITAIGSKRELTKLEKRCFTAAWVIFFFGMGVAVFSQLPK